MLDARSLKYFLIFITVLLLNNHAYALGFSPWTTVTQIVQGQGSIPIVKLADMGETTTTCNSTGYLRFQNADAEPGKRHFAMLLAALSSGKEVKIKTVSCSSDYAYIDTVYIRN